MSMFHMQLTRDSYTDMGTFGKLYIPELELDTVELPWRENRPRISCVPEGTYTLQRSIFHRGGYETFELVAVPDRTLIKIHIGNTIDDLLGCIAPGMHRGCLKGKWAVLQSTTAFNTMMNLLKDKTHGKITIK